MSKSFADLGLSESTLHALRDVGYESPSPIQEEAIPALLEGRDVIGQAQTGTGKTAAFGLPIMEYIDPSEPTVQALVLTPTRELCIQVTQALRTYGAHSGIDVVAVFGGAPIRTQQAQLRGGGHVVVGTVGRVLDLISRHSLVLHDCRFVVLDEADEMLDLGFLEDVEKILSLTPSSRQTALFSATMPPPIRKLADRYMYDPTIIQVEAATLTIDTVAQFQLPSRRRSKPDKLVEVLRAEAPDQAIVFVRTKIRCDQLFRTLRDRGMNVRALHGDMSQGSRDGVMLAFKGGRVPILVATDVAARGPGHLDGHPRGQLRRAHQPRHLRAPHRAHRAASGARAARSRSSRTARSASWRRSNATSGPRSHSGSRARWRRPRPSRSARAGTPSRASRGATSRSPTPSSCSAAAARRASAWPTSSARSPPRRGSTARPCATCSCSTASRSCRCPPPRPSA